MQLMLAGWPAIVGRRARLAGVPSWSIAAAFIACAVLGCSSGKSQPPPEGSGGSIADASTGTGGAAPASSGGNTGSGGAAIGSGGATGTGGGAAGSTGSGGGGARGRGGGRGG